MRRGGRRTSRVFAVLLRLYPRAFRARFGAAMAETFAEELADAGRTGRRAVVALWLKTLVRAPFLAADAWRLRPRAGRDGNAGRRRRALAAFADGWVQDLRWAVRALARSPGLVLATVLTVGLGVGATASLFSVVNVLLLRPLPVHAPDRLVRLHEERTGTMSAGPEGARIPYARYRAYAEAASGVFDGLAGQNLRYLGLRADGPAYPVAAVLASANYFDVLGVRPALGRFFAADDEPVVVLGHRHWRQRFGGAVDVIGRTVHVSGHALTVAGVAPPGFGGTVGFLAADIWVPFAAHGGVAWAGAWVSPFGRLRDGVEKEAAAAHVRAVARRIPTGDDAPVEVHGARLEAMTAVPASMAGALRGFLGMLLGTAVLVLLIAGANVAGVLLARVVDRRRELGVRLALGVGRARLVRQLLVETVIPFVMAGIVGVFVAFATTRLLGRLRLPVDAPVVLDAVPDLRVVGFAIAVAVATGVLFGLAPAVQAAAGGVAPVLRDGGHGASRRRGRARDVFVAGQLALSVLLLVVAALFVRTLQRSLSLDPGFDADGVVIATTNLAPRGYDEARGRAFHAQLLERVRALPGVESAALAHVALLTGDSEVFGGWRTSPDAPTLSAGVNIVDDAYFGTMRVRLAAGRGIAAADVTGAPAVVVINETMARRLWPGEAAVGRVVWRGEEPHEVVGVVRDGAYVDFAEAVAPFAFLSAAQRYGHRRVLHARLRPDVTVAATVAALHAEVAALDADVAVDTRLLSDAIGVLLFPQRLAAALVGVFGLLGLTLAAVGVYGVLAHDVARRLREFGIRVALGADARRLVGPVLGRGALLAVAGGGAGLAAAAAVTRLLQGFLYGVSPLDPPAFVGVPLALGAVALLASWLPARRALRVDPAEALRRE